MEHSRLPHSSGHGIAAKVVCLALPLLGVLALGAAFAEAAVIVVDDDAGQCRKADHSSISAAVAAAEPGDRVKVCPGLYTGAVSVTKPGLKLTAKGRPTRTCFDPTPAPADPTRHAIVTAPGARAFDLQADRITLAGFVVQGSTQGIGAGQGFSGYRVRRNLIQQNTLGAVFGGNGDRQSRLSHNCIRRNGAAPSEPVSSPLPTSVPNSIVGGSITTRSSRTTSPYAWAEASG